jgi:spermidine synthase
VDPQPAITFSEQDGVRFLHFGSPWVQGAMRLSDPVALELAYVRDMMAWLLLLEPPAQILQLGLGAGSLTRFCYRHCRQSEITVVEVSRVVIEAAHRWFKLPRPDERLDIVRADAGVYVARPRVRGRFGVVQVDLYDEDAAGPVLDSEDFYRGCHAALATPGVMTVNLFGRHTSFKRSLTRIRSVFDDVVTLAPRDEGNLVVLALKGPPLRVDRRTLFERADYIKAHYGLVARGWAKTIRASLPPVRPVAATTAGQPREAVG